MAKSSGGSGDAERDRAARCSPAAVRLLAAIVATCAFPSSALAAPCPSLAGIWLGVSHCSAPAATTACKEERVRYRIAADRAGFAMHGERASADGFTPMGDILLICDARQGRWISEVASPNARGRWSFSPAGEILTGELRLHNGIVVRQVTAQRSRP